MIEYQRQYENRDCPSDETLTLWVQGLLANDERARLESHAESCVECRDLLATLAEVKDKEAQINQLSVPQQFLSSARQIIKQAWENQIVTIFVKISQGVYTAAETTGRILYAPWLEPGMVTRAEAGTDNASVVVETVYQNMRCLIETSRTQDDRHTLRAVFTSVSTGRPIECSLFVLFEENEEIESQMSTDGKVVFEDLPPGSYRLTLTLPDRSQGHLDFHLIPS